MDSTTNKIWIGELSFAGMLGLNCSILGSMTAWNNIKTFPPYFNHGITYFFSNGVAHVSMKGFQI